MSRFLRWFKLLRHLRRTHNFSGPHYLVLGLDRSTESISKVHDFAHLLDDPKAKWWA